MPDTGRDQQRLERLEFVTSVFELLSRTNDDLSTRLDEVTELVAAAWPAPERADCRVVLDHYVFQTEAFEEDAEPVISHTFASKLATRASIHVILRAPDGTPRAYEKIEDDFVKSVAELLGETTKNARNLKLFERTFQALGDPVFVIDTSGEGRRIVNANRAAEEVFGYSPEELIGSTTEKLHVNSEAFQNFGELDDTLTESGEMRANFPMQRKSGKIFEAEQVVRVIDPQIGLESGAVSIIRDVSPEYEARERLRASERRLRQIAESIDDAFWIMSPEGQSLSYLSPAFEKIWGLDVEEVLDDIDVWYDTIVEVDRDMVLEQRLEGPVEFEYRIVRPDGESRWIQDRVFPIFAPDGKKLRIVGVSKDVTRRVDLENMLRQSQKMEAVGRLASGVAHDFNNLLSVILGGADLIRADLKEGEPLAEELDFIRDAARRGADLTRQLLAFSQDHVHEVGTVDAGEIVRGMSDILTRSIPEDIRIEFKVERDPLPVRADAGQFEQVLLNLALNARDAMPEGGTLRIEMFTEDVSPEAAEMLDGVEPGPHVVLEMSDTGVGMSSETQSRVFEPFFTTKGSRGGTGLGLAMVYGFARKHGGGVDVKTQKGEGSTFVIRLPLRSFVSRQPQETEDPPTTDEVESLFAMVVEDEQAVRRVVRRILERAGYEVEAFENPADAIERMKEMAALDVVVTDLVLRESSGRELLNWVTENRPGTACVLMSGYAQRRENGEARIPSHAEFLNKPFSHNELLEAVERAMDSLRG